MEGQHSLELVRHRVAPVLRGLVAGMVGMSERSAERVHRRQPAGTVVPLVLSFGDPLRIDALADGAGAGRAYGSFVAGLSQGVAASSFVGVQRCVQVYLTPTGIQQILSVPGSEVARQVVTVADISAALGDHLAEQLHDAGSWEARFALVEDLLLSRLARADPAPDWVRWMWSEIARSAGRVAIRDLVRASGWSHRHVSTTFARHVGLGPKELAGVVRFESASADLGRRPLATIAAEHGYADQSHFAREVARYAGETPTQLLAARRPTPATQLVAARTLRPTG
ncbi:helix-turn-helix transcriptional regulator [Pseudactinotalea suaedae]|uniref:helix-turn-helix transcriptional regulator n=1 Tax=Pseudactinotalea suaedae TaxID=1524924 RepID=UPI0012E13AD2|nr:helix-turn-helix domain-containing protein [Pseudactinotalea suaedae]